MSAARRGGTRPGDPSEELRGRIAEALAASRRLTGGREDLATGEDDLRHAIGALVAQLERRDPQLGEGAAQARHEAGLHRIGQRFADRAEALERADGAVRRLRAVTAPATMLQRAPAELVASSELRRVVVSLVRGRLMTAEAVHVDGDDAQARTLLAALRAHPVPLEHPLVEAEALRRRHATLVTQVRAHPRVDREMADAMRWDDYLVAPVAIGASAIAVLHADRGPGLPLDTSQRDVLWAFATGLAQAYESASLRRTLRHEREQMRQLLAWLDARSGELSDAAIDFVPDARPHVAPIDAGEPLPGAHVRDDDSGLAGLLTRRELEVLRLLARGRTNRAIADELVVSSGTVKFHVNSILRKLRVSNRAEAVARYYALRGRAERAGAGDD